MPPLRVYVLLEWLGFVCPAVNPNLAAAPSRQPPRSGHSLSKIERNITVRPVVSDPPLHATHTSQFNTLTSQDAGARTAQRPALRLLCVAMARGAILLSAGLPPRDPQLDGCKLLGLTGGISRCGTTVKHVLKGVWHGARFAWGYPLAKGVPPRSNREQIILGSPPQRSSRFAWSSRCRMIRRGAVTRVVHPPAESTA